ncbi:exonuclease domain-containing protein [Oribacterium sp. WCC10]|uniref:exonuclease domain-containing protein n=1 Tax=Oribacterium sp. WCC10 TaxID=1855343 RepID=UPI0008E6DF7D|nr:exonuclease domain-containing protein [Oribacterium sp. WCC10]SFG68385.1 Inhibitor of the KinA pathway to sporulation, predicted exonuclease [Oribacterium sp. WCC10]
MIGFFDAEFNSLKQADGSFDYSLIDIAVIPCKSKKSIPTKKPFQSFSRPEKNGGKVYRHIQQLTNIPQSVIDKADSFPVVYRAFRDYIIRNNITRIFTWGGSDVPMMRWNCEFYRIPMEERDILSMFVDIAPEICSKLGTKAVTSLENASYICCCPSRDRHNALDDARSLYEIVNKTELKQFSYKRSREFHEFEGHRNDFITAKQLMESLRVHGTDLKDLLDRINKGEKFPSFFEYIDQKETITC